MRFSTEHGMTVRRIGDGPELVWIHGLGEASTCFDPVVAAMPGWTHVLPDLPGCGRSAWAPPCGLDELATRLAAWLGERAPAPLIGHSMGGVLAVLLAERAAVRAIVNIEGNLSAGDCVFSLRAATQSREAFVAGGFATLRDWVFDRSIAERPMRGYHGAMVFASPEMFHANATSLVAISRTETLAPRLAKVAERMPVLYVAGVPDGICARSRELLAEHRVPWRGIEPAGHWVYEDRKEDFVEAVTGFLRESGRDR